MPIRCNKAGETPLFLKGVDVTEFLTSDGVKIKYTSKGSGRALVFIHGWSGNSQDFSLVARRLSWQFRTVIYDLRGHGMSGHEGDFTMERLAQDLRELLDYLKIDDFILVGYSLGGQVMLEYLRNNPSPQGLVFADTSPKIGEDIYTEAEAKNNLQLMETDFYKFYRSFLSRMLPDENEEDIDKLLDLRKRVLDRNHLPSLAELWQDMNSRDYWQDLEKIKLPSLILRGEYSFHPLEVAELMNEKLENSHYVEFEDCTHQFILEEPILFGEEITGFAQSI